MKLLQHLAKLYVMGVPNFDLTATLHDLFMILILYPPMTDGFPPQRPVTGSFDIFFHLRLNKTEWFETPSH